MGFVSSGNRLQGDSDDRDLVGRSVALALYSDPITLLIAVDEQQVFRVQEVVEIFDVTKVFVGKISLPRDAIDVFLWSRQQMPFGTRYAIFFRIRLQDGGGVCRGSD